MFGPLFAQRVVFATERLQTLRCITRGMGDVLNPFAGWGGMHLNNLVAKTIASCMFCLTATLSHAALAQDAAAQMVPSQNLEAVAPAPGLPPLTVTNALEWGGSCVSNRQGCSTTQPAGRANSPSALP
jgi:hypothetical protein